MNQRYLALLIFLSTLLAGVGFWIFGVIDLKLLIFIPDRIKIILFLSLNKVIPSFKIYILSAAAVLLPTLIAAVPELELRKKDDTPFTLVAHLLIVCLALIGVDFAVLGVLALLMKVTVPIEMREIITGPLVFTGLYASVRVFFWQRQHAGKDTLSRGIEVIFDAKRGARVLSQKASQVRDKGIAIHKDVRLPLSQETKHTLLIAAPGSGKTQVIYPLVERIRARGDALLIYDFKGDFTAAYGEDQGVVILSPFDARGYGWDMAADITTDLKALEFAASLLPDHTAKEPFFKKAAQDLLAGVITRLIIERAQDWTISDLVALLGDKSEVVASCERYRPAALSALGPVDDKQASGVFGELRTGSIQLEYLARAWPPGHRKISLTRWVRDEEIRARMPVIMLRGHQQYRKLDGFLTSLVCSLLIKEALSLPDCYERRIWAILDEFGNLPKIDGIDALLTGVRSKGVRIVAAIQDIAQIEEKYSRYFAQTFFNCFGTILAGICSGATARYLSDAFGKNKIERTQTSKSRGRGGRGGVNGLSVSETEQSVIENALIDTDFSNLQSPSLRTPASFWVRVSGWPIARLAFPVRPLPNKYPSHSEPGWFHDVGQMVKRERPSASWRDSREDQEDQTSRVGSSFAMDGSHLFTTPDLVRDYRPRASDRLGASGGSHN